MPAVVEEAADRSVVADTYGGRVHVEWDPSAAVTPWVSCRSLRSSWKQSGLFDAWGVGQPAALCQTERPKKRDVLGTALLGAWGCWRYAHLTVLVVRPGQSAAAGNDEDRERDAAPRLGSIDAGERRDVDGGAPVALVRPLLSEPWILGRGIRVKPLYRASGGAEVGYNPSKRGRPSHSLHTPDGQCSAGAGCRGRAAASSTARVVTQEALWRLLERIGRGRTGRACCAATSNWGSETVLQRCEQEGLLYLLRLRQTAKVKQALERAMSDRDWAMPAMAGRARRRRW